MVPAIAAFLLFLALPPVVSHAQEGKASPHSKPVPSPGASALQDKAIESDIQARLGRSKIGKNGFKVRVQGGVAFWEGQTPIPQHKGAATRMAKSAGASRVVNNIQVSAEGRERAAANLETGRRRVQVKRGDERSQP